MCINNNVVVFNDLACKLNCGQLNKLRRYNFNHKIQFDLDNCRLGQPKEN